MSQKRKILRRQYYASTRGRNAYSHCKKLLDLNAFETACWFTRRNDVDCRKCPYPKNNFADFKNKKPKKFTKLTTYHIKLQTRKNK